MRQLKLILITLVVGCFFHPTFGQLNVNVGLTPTQYVQQLLGPGITVSNVTYSGSNGNGGGGHVKHDGSGFEFNININQIGSFSNGNSTNIGLTAGLILSNGEVTDAQYPDGTPYGQYPSGYPANANSYNNDPDLNALTGNFSYNCSVLEFDFVPKGNHISFDYVFASSEYPGWVGSSYNDVFGFFLSGPGISGAYSNGSVNIAIIPSTSTPVSINNVNGGPGSNGGCPNGSGKNSQYYVNNCKGTTIPYHGFTTVLTAEYDVECGKTYHIKLAVGDIDDVNWDSAIFLKKNSLTSPGEDASIDLATDTGKKDTVTICEGESVILDATVTGVSGGTYEWDPNGQTTSSITVSPTLLTTYVAKYNYTSVGNACTPAGTVIITDTIVVVVHPIPDITVTTISPCNNGIYSITGTLNTPNAPAVGDLIIEDCTGKKTVVASAPFAKYSYDYNLTGLDANGNNCTLTAYFSTSPSCKDTKNITAPSPCNTTCSITNLTANVSACAPTTSTFSITGTVEFTDAPSTGQLIVEDCNGKDTIINPPFSSPVNYSISGVNADGANCSITAYFSADASCTSSVNYTNPAPCTASCNMDSLGVTIGTCNGTTNTFQLKGTLKFSSPPTTGQLIIEDCNGNDTIINSADFSSPLDFSISGLPADGTNCTITAYFTADPSCSLSLNYTNPDGCSCIVDVGTFNVAINGEGQKSGGTYRLCYGDTITVLANGNFKAPNDIGGDPTETPPVAFHPGIGYLIYTCPPSVFPPNKFGTDPCFSGYSFGYSGPNGGIILANETGTPPSVGSMTNNTLYIVPITYYDTLNGYYSYSNSGAPCYDMGDPIAVQYLPEIVSSNPIEDCQNGTFEVTISGGLPQIDGSNFTASNLLPATASFVNTSCSEGGTIQLTGLQDGDMYSFDITDGNGCPIRISGGPFLGLPTADAGIVDTAACDKLSFTLAANPSFGIGTWTGPAGVTFSDINSPTATVTVPSIGNYTFTWTEDNTNGCADADQVVITFIENPTYTSTPTPAHCGKNDGKIVLVASNGTAPYQYSIDSGENTQATGTFSSLTDSTYSIFIIDANKCQVTGTEIIKGKGAPTIDNVSPTNASCHNICDGEIMATITGGATPITYAWTDDNGNPVGTNTTNITDLCNGTYNLTITDANSCSVTHKNIVITEPAAIDSSFDVTNFCVGTSNAATNIATPGGVFTFNPAVVDGAMINPSTGEISNGVGGTTYTVKYTATIDGCTATSTQDVTVSPIPNPYFTGDKLMGCAPHTVNFTNNNTTGTSASCIWNFGDGTTADNCNATVTHTYNTSGSYTVTLTVSSNGCTGKYEENNYITVIPKPTASFTANPIEVEITNPEVDFLNTSLNATKYIWTFGDNSPSETDINVSHTFPNEAGGNYTVTLIASNGEKNCSDTTRIAIRVKEQLIFYVPNTFTPDGDDFNPTFTPVFTAGFAPSDYTLLIYNRWGELLFESHDAATGWNGTYGGKIVPDGTYIWKITFKEAVSMSDKRHTEVGHINILR